MTVSNTILPQQILDRPNLAESQKYSLIYYFQCSFFRLQLLRKEMGGLLRYQTSYKCVQSIGIE